MPSRKILVKGRWITDPRQTRAGRALRDKVIGEEPVCRLQLPGICTGRSTRADHIKPVESHPELAMVRSNLRGTCDECNRARGNLPDELLNTAAAEVPEALGIFDG